MMIASRHGDFPVKKGDKLAGTRIIPLVIEKEKMDRAAEVVGTEPIFSILPYKKKKVGIVTTGSEVQKGLITDTFTPVLRDKFAKFPSEVIGQTKPGDDMEQITADIRMTELRVRSKQQEPASYPTVHLYFREL